MVCVVGCIRDLIWPPPDQLIVIVVSVWDRAAWKSPPGGLLDDALLSFPFSLWARDYVSLYAGIRSWGSNCCITNSLWISSFLESSRTLIETIPCKSPPSMKPVKNARLESNLTLIRHSETLTRDKTVAVYFLKFI